MPITSVVVVPSRVAAGEQFTVTVGFFSTSGPFRFYADFDGAVTPRLNSFTAPQGATSGSVTLTADPSALTPGKAIYTVSVIGEDALGGTTRRPFTATFEVLPSG